MRAIIALSVLLLAACGGADPVKPDQPHAADLGPKPTATTPDAAAFPSSPEGRLAALNFQCGGESIRVAFEAARAVMVNDDGSNTELAKLPADANSTPGVDVFSDGKLTVTHRVANDGSQVVKFARGKMAFQDCAPSAN